MRAFVHRLAASALFTLGIATHVAASTDLYVSTIARGYATGFEHGVAALSQFASVDADGLPDYNIVYAGLARQYVYTRPL